MDSLIPVLKINSIGPATLSDGPNVVKNIDFKKIVLGNTRVNEANKKAYEILEDARHKAEDIIEDAKKLAEGIAEKSYQSGIERANIDSAVQLGEISKMASVFFDDIEDELVQLILDSVREFVSSFDDREVVQSRVKKAITQMGSELSIELWVSPEVYDLHESGVDGFDYHSMISIRRDSDLTGSNCRIDNGKMVLIADSSVQLDEIRNSLINVFKTPQGPGNR